MAEGSAAYANMRRALLSLVDAIPAGAVVEIAALAAALNIPARHAAHILSRLTEDEAEMLPWHRVIPAGGAFTAAQMARPRSARQIALLRAEGARFVTAARIDLDTVARWSPPDDHAATIWADLDDDRPAARRVRSRRPNPS